MLLRLLRLIPLFRAMEERAAEADEARAQLQTWQDRVEQADREISFLREQMARSIEAERYTYQSWLNFQIQPQYGTAPFPAAATIPQDSKFADHPDLGPSGRQYRTPSMAQAEAAQRFLEKSRQKLRMQPVAPAVVQPIG